MSNIAANVMPARAVPAGEATPLRPIIVFGSRPGVGATTVATVARAALMEGAALPRLLTVVDGVDGSPPDAGAETVDFDAGGDMGVAFVRLAETLAEGHVVVDCAAGAASRVFAQADAANVGHLISRRAGVCAVVIVGPSLSSAVRAEHQIAWLTTRGRALLGISHIAAVAVNPVDKKTLWDRAAHEALRGRLASSKVGIGAITYCDLSLLTEFGVEMLTGSKAPDFADIAAKLGVTEVGAEIRVSLLKGWRDSSVGALRAAGVIPPTAAAKAA